MAMQPASSSAPTLQASPPRRSRLAIAAGVALGASLLIGGWLFVQAGRRIGREWSAAMNLQLLGAAVDWKWDAQTWRRGGTTQLRLLDRQFFLRFTDADLVQLKSMRRLEVLDLSQCGRVTDAGLRSLSGLSSLRELHLGGDGTWPGPRITDAGLVHLRKLTRLELLDLRGTAITDSGLGHLKGMGNLDFLDLSGTQVTDAGLALLKTLPRLRTLALEKTMVTARGVQDLRRARPDLEIDTGGDDDSRATPEATGP